MTPGEAAATDDGCDDLTIDEVSFFEEGIGVKMERHGIEEPLDAEDSAALDENGFAGWDTGRDCDNFPPPHVPINEWRGRGQDGCEEEGATTPHKDVPAATVAVAPADFDAATATGEPLPEGAVEATPPSGDGVGEAVGERVFGRVARALSDFAEVSKKEVLPGFVDIDVQPSAGKELLLPPWLFSDALYGEAGEDLDDVAAVDPLTLVHKIQRAFKEMQKGAANKLPPSSEAGKVNGMPALKPSSNMKTAKKKKSLKVQVPLKGAKKVCSRKRRTQLTIVKGRRYRKVRGLKALAETADEERVAETADDSRDGMEIVLEGILGMDINGEPSRLDGCRARFRVPREEEPPELRVLKVTKTYGAKPRTFAPVLTQEHDTPAEEALDSTRPCCVVLENLSFDNALVASPARFRLSENGEVLAEPERQGNTRALKFNVRAGAEFLKSRRRKNATRFVRKKRRRVTRLKATHPCVTDGGAPSADGNVGAAVSVEPSDSAPVSSAVLTGGDAAAAAPSLKKYRAAISSKLMKSAAPEGGDVSAATASTVGSTSVDAILSGRQENVKPSGYGPSGFGASPLVTKLNKLVNGLNRKKPSDGDKRPTLESRAPVPKSSGAAKSRAAAQQLRRRASGVKLKNVLVNSQVPAQDGQSPYQGSSRKRENETVNSGIPAQDVEFPSQNSSRRKKSEIVNSQDPTQVVQSPSQVNLRKKKNEIFNSQVPAQDVQSPSQNSSRKKKNEIVSSQDPTQVVQSPSQDSSRKKKNETRGMKRKNPPGHGDVSSESDKRVAKKRFPNLPALKKCLVKTANGDMFKCPLCWKLCKYMRTLQTHYTKMHLEKGSFLCSYCGLTFNTRARLRQHNYFHSQTETYQCKHCNASFNRSDKLMEHEISHTEDGHFQCHLCLSKYDTAEQLSLHSLIHTGVKPINCTQCDSMFVTWDECDKHMKTHLKKLELEGKGEENIDAVGKCEEGMALNGQETSMLAAAEYVTKSEIKNKAETVKEAVIEAEEVTDRSPIS